MSKSPPHSLLPAWSWLHRYNLHLFRQDAGAAFTVAVVLIPQAIAYAALAEMPPEYGLYAALVPLPVFAMLTTSRHVSVGPFALVSLLISETVSSVLDPITQPHRYRHAVMLLSFMTGLLHLAMASIRLDVIVAFLADSVIEGFTSASAILIATSQLKHLLGMPVARARLPLMIADVLSRLHEVNLRALLLGVGSIALLLSVKQLNKRLCPKIQLPEMLVLLLATVTLIGASTPHSALNALLPASVGPTLALWMDVPVVGDLARTGLPPVRLPLKYYIVGVEESDGELGLLHLKGDWHTIKEMVGPALVVGLFSYILTMSIAKSIAIRYAYRVDANAELRALGVANLFGAFFSAFPISGSLSRSALVVASAGTDCTPMHGVLTSVLVLMVILFAMPLVGMMPYDPPRLTPPIPQRLTPPTPHQAALLLLATPQAHHPARTPHTSHACACVSSSQLRRAGGYRTDGGHLSG